jgi:hypothetical protein
VFRSGPPLAQPGSTAQPSSSPLRVAGARRQLYQAASATARDPRLQVFLSDMVAPYQLAYHDEPRLAGLGQSYSEMCQPLIESLVPADEPVDLLVLAYDLHDLRPGQATSVYLSHVCPGGPLALSVCDQGTAAGFTALRLIQTYAQTGTVRRALLLVAEQATVHYDLPVPAPTPDGHAAVALLLDIEGGFELAPVRQRAAVAPGEVRSALAAEVAAAGGGPDGRTLLLGPGLEFVEAAGIAAERVLRAPAGQPCTGAWWELAGALTDWQDAEQVLLADYAPALGYLSVVALRPARRSARIGA